MLYHVVTNNTKKNKNLHNAAIEYYPKFDDNFSFSNGSREPLTVITVILRGGKKQRAKLISVLTCM